MRARPKSLKSAEIIENLERRHLNKDELAELTKALVALRTKENQSELQKKLNDNLSQNPSQEPKTHAKTKVEGAKRGRPVTAEGQAKKEIAAKTGQSVRNVQRSTSAKVKQASEPAKRRRGVTSVDSSLREFDRYVSKIIDYVLELKRKLLSSSQNVLPPRPYQPMISPS